MKRIIYLLGILMLLSSCSNTKSKIISKADDLFGESEVKDNNIKYHQITADNINKDFYAMRDFISEKMDAQPIETRRNFMRADSTGHYTVYIWNTQYLSVMLWLNYPAKDKYVQLTFKKKSSGGI